MTFSSRNKIKAGKNFFFEKKKQKTFAHLDRAGETATGPKSKSFLGTPGGAPFFQKSTLTSGDLK
jgi:hypothetical protein